jgi:hypothetical protein
MAEVHVWDFLEEFVKDLEAQLKSDEERWGNTWQHRIRGGQESRIYNHITDYYDQWNHGKNPMPWLKVAGLAMIAWIRERHPEVLFDG